MATTEKKYIDLAYLQEFWKLIKNIPNQTSYTVTLPNGYTGTAAQSIVNHLKDLYIGLATTGVDANKHSIVAKSNDDTNITLGTTTDADTGGTIYTIGLSSSFLKRISDLKAAETNYVKKTDVTGGGTVSEWGDSASITVNDKTLAVTLPADPTAGISGGASETKNGIQVSINNTSLAPTVSVTPGTIESGNTSVVTGGAVYTAIENAKSLQEQIKVSNADITGGTLISGKISVNSATTGNGSADLTLTPTLTDTDGATAIATDAYVNAAVLGKKIEYSFGSDVTLRKNAGKSTTTTEIYDATLTLMKSVDGANAEAADTVNISIDATEFIKDSFLQSAAMGTGADANKLILTMQKGTGKAATTETIKVDLAQFIDTYTAGNKGIVIDATTKTISAKADGTYIEADSTNGIQIKSSMIADNGSETDHAKLATKGYVDEKAKTSAVSVALAGSTGVVEGNVATIDAFGETGSINVKTSASDTTGKTLSVTLPSFAAGTSTSGNVSVAITTDGTITTTTTEQAGSGDYANDKALAQAGYVDQKVAGVKLKPGAGINIAADNTISAKTAGYVSNGTSGIDINSGKITDVTGATSTGTDKNLVTKGYVDNAFKEDKITLTSTYLTITDTDSKGKDFDISVPVAVWNTADKGGLTTDLFPYNED